MNKVSKEKKIMSIGMQHFINYILGGLFFCVSSIMYLISNLSYKVFDSCLIICIVYLVISCLPYFVNKEMDDELSKKNLEKAKAKTTDNFVKVLSIFVIIILFLPKGLYNDIFTKENAAFTILYFTMGIQHLMTGIYYIKFEKSDEECSF